MKHLFSLSVLMLMMLPTMFAQGSKQETATFQVMGNCGMCKKRIETAAKIKGVSIANWNMETQQMDVKFNPQKTSLATIQQSIAKAGHATEKFKADEKAYSNLHHCCKYKDE
jgi:copper chaperone CopZ